MFFLTQLHKDIEARDEQITKLQSENDELQELAQHVQYMADMIEVSNAKRCIICVLLNYRQMNKALYSLMELKQ